MAVTPRPMQRTEPTETTVVAVVLKVLKNITVPAT